MNNYLTKIKNASDINPRTHDGSYELVQKAVELYSKMNLDSLDIEDINLIYVLTIGTWASGIEAKRRTIEKSNMSTTDKSILKSVLDQVAQKAEDSYYSNSQGENKHIGMLGSGFHSFKRLMNKEDAIKLIRLLVDLYKLNSEEECYQLTDNNITSGIKGIQSASASGILHCLKPTVFPIINGRTAQAHELLKVFDIELKYPKTLETYISNSRQIKKFRDENCIFKNYRVFDILINEYLEDQKSYTKVEDSLEGWFPKDYGPNISTDEWLELLSNDAVFNNQALRIMKRMLDIGGAATCKQLSEKYGGHINLYNVGSSSLAMRVAKETKCPVMESDTENSKWWPILYLGRYTKNKDEGIYKWRLRPELKLALEQFDLSNINLYELKTSESSSYSKTDFLDEVYMEEDKYNELVKLLDIKKNIILQGAPGVGKTFMAKRLAYSILGEKDDTKIEVVQFHQNYSYEDFVMGYKPNGDGFGLEEGIFYKFCIKANSAPNNKYFFIIDEINRGNLSKVFGELLMLIEADKRGEDVSLAYSKESFSVPKNLYIIGMMNTADRSLAMIDYALRRRFSFFEMEPAFRSTGFKAYQNKLNHDRFDRLIKKVEDLNNAIEEDSSLGRGFCIGHSYFCGRSFSDDEWIRLVINYDILPMLKEYYFDDESSYEKWERELLGILDE